MRIMSLSESDYNLIKRCIDYYYESQMAWIDEEEHITNKDFVETMHVQHEKVRRLKNYVDSVSFTEDSPFM